ncbi:MAG: pyruvate dehydrogenase (acetyl-transferring) E1 component subunit alpha [Nannocystaceae bacterium]|nr:pyruvate dehydrogenase (acetyl-transferring) E1 component subunit alpha [Nannocystaceae bacterium]
MTTLDREPALQRLHEMVRMRRFEEKTAELYSDGKIRGFLHLYVGEEAIAAGLMPLLGAQDNVVSTYREHGHALARGVTARAVMAEMFGRVDGCSRGRGGSMHLFSTAHRFWGGNAIVAGGLPLAVGLALADAMRGRSAVTVCFFGDGAVAEGEFHESLNLAALWRLPVLFACENNQYAMGTALERYAAQPDPCRKAEALGVPARRVDGMDVEAVSQASAELIAAVREGQGPRFVEFATYRFRAHSMFDAQLYRSKDEVERWRERDPIASFEARLRQRGWIDDAARAAIDAAVASEVDDAVAFADASPWEPVEQLLRDVTTPRAAP